MKKIIFIILLLITSISYGQVTTKELTVADPILNVIGLGEWLEIAVSDTGAADTVLVYYPMTSVTGVTTYASMGKIMDLSTGENVTGLYGSADSKVYILWVPDPRAVRFVLSSYASGDVYITTVSK